MMSRFRSLMEPIDLGRGFKARNRLYFSPVGYDLCDATGFPRPGFFEVYKKLIASGCSFGFLGNATIQNESRYSRYGLTLTSDAHAEALKPILEAGIHSDTIVGVQLQHYGIIDQTEAATVTPNISRGGVKSINNLDNEEIHQFIRLFVSAALRVTAAGGRMIQLHAANGYLLSSFLSPLTNQRTDGWGGTIMRRATALFETVRATRAAVGRDVVIFVRLQIDDGLGDRGFQVEHVGEIAAALDEAGCDAVTLATGVRETFHRFMSDANMTHAVSLKAGRIIKTFTTIPIGFAGNVATLEQATRIIEGGDIDFIGFARPLIADPKFVIKQLNGQRDAVRYCRWDSFCLRDKKEPEPDQVFCCVNPSMARPEFLQQRYENE